MTCKNTRSSGKTLEVAPLRAGRGLWWKTGLPDFFLAYGQTPDKKWPNYGQNHKFLNYGNFHIHRCLTLFGKQYIFCRKNVVLPKKQVFTLKQQFLP